MNWFWDGPGPVTPICCKGGSAWETVPECFSKSCPSGEETLGRPNYMAARMLAPLHGGFLAMVQFRVTLSERRGMGLVYDTRNLDKVEFQSPHCIAAVGVMETDHFIKLFFVMIK